MRSVNNSYQYTITVHMLPITFQFIKDNWNLIRILWHDLECNAFDHYVVNEYDEENDKFYQKGDLYEQIIKKEDMNKTPWSCFFAADFILDLYGVYSRIEQIEGDAYRFFSGFHHLPAKKSKGY